MLLPMGFGKNPHVAKAEAAEQKAQVATDEAARTLAWREAARQWDRAAEREQRGGVAARGQSYTERAEAARAAADNLPEASSDELSTEEVTDAADAPSDPDKGGPSGRWLN
jgi:hypothetical protein